MGYILSNTKGLSYFSQNISIMKTTAAQTKICMNLSSLLLHNYNFGHIGQLGIVHFSYSAVIYNFKK